MKKKKILVIEDNATTAKEIADNLKYFGYDTITSFHGEKAVDLFNNDSEINLIVMGIEDKAGLSGVKTASILVNKREVPIIFWASDMDKNIVNKVRRITPFGHIVKKSESCVLLSFVKLAYEYFEASQPVINNNIQQSYL